ncbi:hypothetical protein KK083_24970 [Fulvivirgaceae bacterium PWU4]|uniref:Capsule assembly Wzi family protein n=1 Tax=Chryseosolibacter histidini TaxID=2782349 RepID=A0AAP2GRM6_9BACT|nr:hypothetical protein [Chryseosolibacter histidini]MBT1700165.1 hypothetical protein [Chryseosolibacter histidini]
MKLLFFLLLLIPSLIFAQSNYAPLNEDYYHWIDRYEVKSGQIIPEIFTSVKPYRRSAIVAFIDTAASYEVFQSAADEFNRTYLQNDNWEWSRAASSDSRRPVLRHFYKKKSDFFHVDTEDFDLHINPVLYVGAGNDSRRNERLFVNTRGIEVRGMVDKKVGFYTYLTDNQALLPSYVSDWMTINPVVPHEGFWKSNTNGDGVDFLQARGYITFEATRHINLQLGHDRLFIGNGYRSLIFSDFAPPAFFLKGNVKVWKLNYLFMVNQMIADNKNVNNSYPNKFNALHHLSINIGKKLNLGIFESVVFSADDSTSADHFRMEYLNPIIFYRAIEQQNGSTDNALLGFDFKWNAVKKLSFYGQFVLDEFVISHIRARDGWWANKYGIQAGGKYIDAFGVANLDLQGEFNIVRPYTYSHFTNYGSYSSYRQPIAHPLGANFKEITGILRYQPLPRLNITGKLSMIEAGRDVVGVNWGGDILKNNQSRQQELNNSTGQGISNDILFGSFTASWQFKHNLFVDASVTIRQSESPEPIYNNNTSVSSLALRWNIPQRLYEF